MKEIIKFRKVDKQSEFEKIREEYKKDFKEYVEKREQEEKIVYLDMRKRM